MPSKRFLAVVNPRGGTKRAAAVVERVRPIFAEAQTQLDLRATEYPGHATEIAETVDLSGYDGLCVVGGDGTTHEVVAGLMRRADHAAIPLGLIPAGTGNTLHQEFGCGDPLEAARRIVAGQPHPLDVIRLTTGNETVYCINMIGWGAIADINHKAEKLRMFGAPRYAMASLAQILRPRLRRATVTLDDETIEDAFLFVLACNTKTVGSRMILAPHAKIDDGLFDVVLLRETSRWRMLRLLAKTFDGSHLALPWFEYRQVKSLTVNSREPGPLDVDGEIKGSAPFVAEIMPGALQVSR